MKPRRMMLVAGMLGPRHGRARAAEALAVVDRTAEVEKIRKLLAKDQAAGSLDTLELAHRLYGQGLRATR